MMKSMQKLETKSRREPELSEWAKKEIEEARARIKRGEYITLEELKRQL